MNQPVYFYQKVSTTRYSFTSLGRRQIKKVVDFSPLVVGNMFNMGFGDLLPDGSIDDRANSNNGDIVKILSTVIHILKDFLDQLSDVEVFFTRSILQRTKLYARILKTYYVDFRKEFVITEIISTRDIYTQILFDPTTTQECLGFLIKKNYLTWHHAISKRQSD